MLPGIRLDGKTASCFVGPHLRSQRKSDPIYEAVRLGHIRCYSEWREHGELENRKVTEREGEGIDNVNTP